MIPTPTLLLANVNTNDQNLYVTESISPVADRMLYLFVSQIHANTNVAEPIITGGGVSTWSVVSTVNSTRRRLTCYRAATGASPSTGALTIDYSGMTMASCVWMGVSVSDCVMTGTNGSDSVVQTVTRVQTSGTTFPLSLPLAWSGDDNIGLVGVSINNSTFNLVPNEPSLVEFPNQAGGSSDNARNLNVYYGRNGTAVDFGGTTASATCMAIALELAGAIDIPVLVNLNPVGTVGLNGRVN
jgi:hypothetical protein